MENLLQAATMNSDMGDEFNSASDLRKSLTITQMHSEYNSITLLLATNDVINKSHIALLIENYILHL